MGLFWQKWHAPQEFVVSPDLNDVLFISEIKQVCSYFSSNIRKFSEGILYYVIDEIP